MAYGSLTGSSLSEIFTESDSTTASSEVECLFSGFWSGDPPEMSRISKSASSVSSSFSNFLDLAFRKVLPVMMIGWVDAMRLPKL